MADQHEDIEAQDEVIYKMGPRLERCEHKMRYTGHQCQLAKGHAGRHAWEPYDEPAHPEDFPF